MTTPSDYLAARKRVEAWCSAPGTDDETVCIRSTIATITAGDLRAILNPPRPTVEEVARVIAPGCWEHIDSIDEALSLPTLTDDEIQRLKDVRHDRLCDTEDAGLDAAERVIALFTGQRGNDHG